ncbi:sulfatase-like hydrolase/transferase [Snuella sedimenti]|uniref:Sulfatase-like hydrolase/transferase n=1 Tax=Snuella sedimenti TaxID=2798802 RepID=A0A8J7LRT8_9FLAO|nr:sulfatase-like hydrolase/transferase [Snuella sedimenti]MBJ6367590.1 sulfatase-like hydrolase/transferase [Snuella sedimenti]
MNKKRTGLLILLILNCLITLGQKQKPNFILIVADDLGYGDLSLTGSSQIKTPNIDKLAKEGMFFSQGYVSSAVCSPSRAGFITGINQVEFGHDNNLEDNQPGFDPEYLGLPISVKTIADHLKPLGYISGLIGKWHLGHAKQFHPLQRGFDEFWGYTGGGHDYFVSEPNGKGYRAPLECNYKTPQQITYITDDKGDECVDFIKRHKDKAFFLFASFNAPHTPMQATKEDLELYAHIKDSKRRTYAAMVHRLDVNVGKIINTLKNQGLDKNTLVVFISDNGGPTKTNGSINAPYNGKKGTLLEGGIHVPYIMYWPGTIPSGSTYSNPVSSLDFAPTFMALAGGNEKAISFSGVNLLPIITSTTPLAKPHELLKWRFTISAAIRKGEWKLIRLPDRLPLLYHLPSDPSEQNNLALKHLETTKDLLKALGEWDVTLPHPVFLEGAQWKKTQLKQYDAPYKITQPD